MKQYEPEVHTLSNGLRLVHVHHRGAGAGIFGIAVRAGSADEEDGKYGLAHFVEHTIFKGTRRRSSWHVINRMEAVGGELNAFTTKEETVVYSIFPSGNASRAIELISDLAIESQFPGRELDKEREVVIDEINSYRDTPAEAIYDDFEELAFAGTPLAHNILGTPESVRRLESDDCRSFLRRYYTAANMVAFYSGPQSSSRIAPLVERYFSGLSQHDIMREKEALHAPERFETTCETDSHQCHCLLGAHVPGLYSDKRHAVSLFANIIGGPGMNSLLNIELRERRGLVYSVEASTAMFTSGGILNVYFGCDHDDLSRCKTLCADVFAGVADGSTFSPQKLARAKKQYLGQMSISGENRENRIMALARALLFRGSYLSDRETRDAVEAISINDIRALAVAMCNASSLTFK
ncbi:MAG: insulinase family protein [Muribaculaceae bacterium]|nr:insulinase family protein [Muribaculaceae bacterium]MDE6611816.1 insulinase family protein [Muribaculaceae bacterium]